jgi:hypothetical protein
MSDAPRLSVRAIDLFERPVTMRLPFRFGSVTVRETVQAFVRTEVEIAGGSRAIGFAAELKVPKWFDKSPSLSNADNVAQLDRALSLARAAYLSDERPASVFGHHLRHAAGVRKAAAAAGLPPLVASFGLALVDRTLIDAIGRHLVAPFATLLNRNAVGFAPAEIAPDLADLDTAGFLAALAPQDRIAARHTVGLIDPLSADDRTVDMPDDGLPVTLVEVIAAYGHDHFKLKVGGDIDADVARLTRIAAILDAKVGPGRYRVTLDGNEQYPDAASVAELVARMRATPALAHLMRALLLVEQPIARAEALRAPLGALGRDVPVIIDESDGADDALPQALALGYRGVSSKACKGVWRALVNRARLMRVPGGILSAEDLTTQAGLAVQQDLALVSVLGIGHVERNGHHYVDGFAGAPDTEQSAFLAAHPDLYRRHGARVRLDIRGGALDLASVNRAAGLGSAALPDVLALRTVPA